eukprot:COSAG01_NODE_10_length_42970_cov_93.010007_32_plen_281_part_00
MGLFSHMRRRLAYACCIFACLWFFGYGGYEEYEYYHPAEFHGTQLMTPGQQQLTSKQLSGGGGADDVPAKEEDMKETKEEMAEEIKSLEDGIKNLEEGIKNLEDGIADSKADKMDAPEDVQEAPSSPAMASGGAPPAAPRLEWHFGRAGAGGAAADGKGIKNLEGAIADSKADKIDAPEDVQEAPSSPAAAPEGAPPAAPRDARAGRSGAGGAAADGSSKNDSYHCPPPPPMAAAGSGTSGDVCAGQKWSHYPSLPVSTNLRAQPTRALAPLAKASAPPN